MEQQPATLEVNVTSTDTIKPSSPTPPNRKSYILSSLDQNSHFKHFPILLFYANSAGQNCQAQAIDINVLKTSLSETLTQFYPLAGRYHDESSISCNDEGIPFVETRVNASLSDLLNSSYMLQTLGKLLPSHKLYMSYGQQPVSEVLHLAFQVNVFLCGGVVISCYMLHKILDGTSAGLFLNNWATIARSKSSPINLSTIEPDFDAVVKAFPPQASPSKDGGCDGGGASGGDKALAARLAYLKSIKVVGKSFVFSKDSIKKLKSMATTTTDHDHLPNPTSFEVVAGFIWHHIFSAACTAATVSCDVSGTTELLFTANIRTRISEPRIQNSAIGNLTKSVHVRVDKLRGFPELATEIHAAISRMKQNLPGSLPEKGRSIADRGYKFGSYTLTSWCKLGLSEIDFGFGKPNRVISVGMVHPVMRNLVILVDYTDADANNGIESCLFLEEKEMQILESSPQFRVFASPI